MLFLLPSSLLLLLLPSPATSSPAYLSNYLETFHATTTPFSFRRAEAEALFPTERSERKLVYVLQCADLISPAVAADQEIDSVTGLPVEVEPSSKGGDAVEFMKGFRNDSGGWYQTVLDNIMMYTCSSNEATFLEKKVRCVQNTTEDVFKGGGGGCVYPSDTTCGVGECERTSNCYWLAPVYGEDRVQRHTDEEYEGSAAFLGFGGSPSQDSYVFSVGKYFVLGLVLAVLNILIWTVFIIGRCCCCCFWNRCFCRCCSPKPKEEGYTACFQVRGKGGGGDRERGGAGK